MESVYKEEFRLSAGEANAEGEMSIPVLFNKIIEIATTHANSLGIGNPEMTHLSMGWVLSRVVFEASAYPKVNERFSISTWVESWNRHFSVRNFRLDSADGKALIYVRSVWMVLNMETRENAGLGHLMLPEDMISGQTVPVSPQKKHRAIVPSSAAATEGGLYAQEETYHTFRYCDLDYYRHVNTVRYVVLILNQFTLDEMDQNIVGRFEISFLKEGKYGKKMRLLKAEDGMSAWALSFSDMADAACQPIVFARVGLVSRR